MCSSTHEGRAVREKEMKKSVLAFKVLLYVPGGITTHQSKRQRLDLLHTHTHVLRTEKTHIH